MSTPQEINNKETFKHFQNVTNTHDPEHFWQRQTCRYGKS